MILSILICSIPSRFGKAKALYESILSMCEGKDIEVLLFMDNKKRTIGEKREAIKNISQGKYFLFCDDDDSLYSIAEIYEACKNDVDVITYKVKCKNANGSEFIVTCGLGNDVEHTNDGEGNYLDLKRPPFLQAAWNAKFKPIKFPAINYGEDWEWVKKVLKKAKTEIHIPEILQGYNFDPMTSEADAKSNQYWKNPNEVKKAIVNLVTYNEAYIQGQKRLQDSLVDNFDGEFISFVGEEEVGAPFHSENPYAFKIYAIEKVKQMGYNQILWLDASVYAVKSVQPVFDWLTDKGIFLEEAGHWAGTWSPDYVLKYFGTTKEQAMKMPMFSAGFCGFDFRRSESIELFAEWKEAMMNGMFKGTWDVTRHDMSAGSIIANKQGLFPLYSKGGQFFSYIGPGYSEPSGTSVFNLQGLK